MKAITDILGVVQPDPLYSKIKRAIHTFNKLDRSKSYHLAFSGGKDSHVLLVIYLLWKKIFNPKINIKIKFSDTRLESDSLYQLIENIELQLHGKERFQRVYPVNNYWFYQFIIGYPVPNWRNRWCTLKLKVEPMNQDKSIPITGRHYGESEERDKRLKADNCSSGECGVDKIKKSFDPILDFRNCDIWELLFYADGTILYEGVFNHLKKTYNQSETKSGSLRMGCFMCPVVSINTLKEKEGITIRKTLERLRESRRIRNPTKRKGKYIEGAIYIEDRRTIWQELDKDILLKMGYITKAEIKEIDHFIKLNSYPQSYSKEWIEAEHLRIKKQPTQLTLAI
jgi:3'-phosphoadenosine 5'-phosphosulfate sulfotransferase (PAPS reductase)/FAD synthetase